MRISGMSCKPQRGSTWLQYFPKVQLGAELWADREAEEPKGMPASLQAAIFALRRCLLLSRCCWKFALPQQVTLHTCKEFNFWENFVASTRYTNCHFGPCTLSQGDFDRCFDVFQSLVAYCCIALCRNTAEFCSYLRLVLTLARYELRPMLKKWCSLPFCR